MAALWTSRSDRFCTKLGIEHPLIQAPMAGGPTTPSLVGAVSNAGALGSLGAGYLSPDRLRDTIHEIRDITKKPFGVNVFVPESVSRETVGPNARAELTAIASELDLDDFSTEASAPELFEGQVVVLLEEQVPVVSFTFGLLPPTVLTDFKNANSIVIGTATSCAEASVLADAGCDAIVAQGIEAGGHRGSFLGSSLPMVGLVALLPQVVRAVEVPVIATGGIMDGAGIVAMLALGAASVQMGTAFLGLRESGTDPAWVDRLRESNETSTVLTRTFSGKPARGVENDFIRRMAPHEGELPDYPVQNVISGPIRAEPRSAPTPRTCRCGQVKQQRWCGMETLPSSSKP